MNSSSRNSNSALPLRATVAQVVAHLRSVEGIPLNFIHADREVHVDSPAIVGELAAVLDAIVATSREYRWKEVVGRCVVLPTDPVWETVMSGIAISGTPRLEAAEKYIDALCQHVPEMADLVAPLVKGNPNSPVYTEPVTLQPEASVIEHLVQLLGGNNHLVFTIERTPNGRRFLHFEHVAPKKSSRSARS